MGFKEKFETGVFAVLAELDPPKGVNTEGLTANATRASKLIDAYVMSEMSGAVMRMAPLGVAPLLGAHGISHAIEISTHHQNRLSLQGNMLAAHAVGSEAVIVSSGTSPEYGDAVGGTAVADLTYVELLNAACQLRKGQDLSGNALDGSPDYLVGAVIGKSPEVEIQQAVDSGADFVISPPVFSKQSIRELRETCQSRGIALIAKVELLKSVGMARYLQQHISGVSIPDGVIDRLRQANDTADECVTYAAELVKDAKNAGASGVLVCSHGWESRLFDLMTRASV
jgi:methylenetetrahydrofolate reductase (NADPH)